MRLIKLILIFLLVVVGAIFGFTALSRSMSDADVPPSILCDADMIEVSVSAEESVLKSGITAWDKQDGDLTDRIRIQGVSKLITENTAKVTYIVFDSDGNAASCSRMIRYTDYAKPRFQINQALVYSENEDIKLLDRLSAIDFGEGDLTESIRVSTLMATSDPDIYTVSVQVTNSLGDTSRLILPIVRHTGMVVRPSVNLTEYLVYLNQNTTFNAKAYLESVSTPIGAGNLNDVQITDTVDMSVPGTYYVYYRYPYSITTGLAVLTVVVQ